MMVGKAKIPSDLAVVLNNHHASRQQHKTIEHNRTSASFVNQSFNDYGGQMSPLLDTGREQSGRQSLINKKQLKAKDRLAVK